MTTIVFICSLLSVLALGLCDQNNNPARNPWIDLSHSFDEDTIYWLNTSPFRFTKKISQRNPFYYNANEFEAGEHGGTHMDAPFHFNKNGWKIGEIPSERFFVDGVLINVTKEAAEDPDYALEVTKLKEFEQKHGQIKTTSVILVDFGWAKKYKDKNEYYGSEVLKIGTLHFPGISQEAADWIANHRKVIGVGVDTPSADSGSQVPNPVAHMSITAKNKYILENIALDNVSLPSKNFKLIILPMKIKEGTGAPCRVFAVLPQ